MVSGPEQSHGERHHRHRHTGQARPPVPVAPAPAPETTPTVAPTEAAGSLWELNGEALLERLRGTEEYDSIYGQKPDWMSEQDFISSAMAYNQVMTMYYGDRVTVNADGSLTFDENGPALTVEPRQGTVARP